MKLGGKRASGAIMSPLKVSSKKPLALLQVFLIHKPAFLETVDKLSVNYRALFPDLGGLSRHHCLLDVVHALNNRERRNF